MLRSSNYVLFEKSNFELSKMNKCPHDPGKVILLMDKKKSTTDT